MLRLALLAALIGSPEAVAQCQIIYPPDGGAGYYSCPAPAVVASGGIEVDITSGAAPEVGDVLTATNATHATWQAPTGGAVDFTDVTGTATDAQIPNNITITGLSGTNTGDQTKTCGAGDFIQVLAAGTGSTCATPAGAAPTTLQGTTTQSDAVIATYTAITGIAFTPAASTNYIIDCWIVYTSTAATTGINFAWDVPASVVDIFMTWDAPTAAGVIGGGTQRADNVGTAATAAIITTENMAILHAVLRNGANATSTTLGFTPETANSVSVIGAKSFCQSSTF